MTGPGQSEPSWRRLFSCSAGGVGVGQTLKGVGGPGRKPAPSSVRGTAGSGPWAQEGYVIPSTTSLRPA